MRRFLERMKRSRRKGEDGFTLIELLVVLVILGLLVGIAAPAAVRYLSKAKSDVAQIQLKGFVVALDMFRLDQGRYPTTEEGLNVLVKRPAGYAKWNGPFLEGGAIPADPWDRAYIYEGRSGASYTLTTLGADGQRGGEGENADLTATK
jgi:general secretion pathway protein G